MKNLHRLLAITFFFIAGSAWAQSSGTVTNHAFPIGKGPGNTGYTSLLCGSAQLAVGQSAADPICQTITGDVTISAAGVTAIGATKVINAMFATMAANTTKCNATAGVAVPTDCTAATMRTNIGVVIGTNVQAWDTDLDCLAAISTTGIYARTGAGTCAVRTITAPAAGITITNGDGVAGNPTLVLANDLAALEGLSSTGIARRTATDTWSVGTAVSNAELATMAAFTIKANATGSSAVPTDVSIPALTQKASPVAADKVMIADSAASDALKYVLVSSLGSAGSVSSLNGQTGALAFIAPPQGRLTLTTGVPVMATSVSAATTVYYTPYAGNQTPIYDGTNMVPFALAELSIVLGSNWTTNSNWDVFIADDTGTKRACTGPAWTSDTARGTGAGTTEIERISGLWLNKVSITCRYNNTTTFTVAADRGTFVGSFRSGAAGQTNWTYGSIGAGGVAGLFGVFNAYNRVDVVSFSGDSTDSWTYATATWRGANNSATIRHTFLRGLDEEGVTATYNALQTVAATNAYAGVGLDSTTAFSGTSSFSNNASSTMTAPSYNGVPGLGLHFVNAIEYSAGATSTFYGDIGTPALAQSGIAFRTRM